MPRDAILIVLFLRGGADGLSLVCPTSDDNLIAARAEDLRVARKGDAAGRTIRQDIADTDFRFHPALAPLADLYDAGDLSLIHASGLTVATRSHFDAEARIERGLFGITPGEPSGWIGRWLAAAQPQGAMPALAVGTTGPASLIGATPAVGENLADLIVAQGHWLAPALRARLAAGFGDHGPLAAPMQRLLSLSAMVGQRLWSEADQTLTTYAPDHPYPDGALQQDVSVVVMSEFGRRLRGNSAGGTDHGRGNVMMVLGPQAKGGRMLGRWPGLANDALEEGAGLAVVTDYRDVLTELLQGHMGLQDPAQVFPGFTPQRLGLWG